MSWFHYAAPERLQFREGGGVLAVFGLPFFAAGVFMLLSAAGVVAISGGGSLARPVLGLMGLAFTSVGGTLVFGRAWTILDVAERAAIKSWGLLVPFRAQPRRLDDFARVRIGFEPGDSDSSEKFPVTLEARSGPDFVVCSPTAYDQARACAAEAAKHLGFALEDATGDHAVTLDAADVDAPLQQRASREATREVVPSRPAAARSEVHRETTGVRVVIPQPRMNPFGLLFALAPSGLLLWIAPSLWEFFQQTRTPEGIGVAFLAMLVLFFGVLPATSAANAWLRSRRGYLEIRVSRDGVTVRERGAWRIRTVAAIEAGQILDVDYGTRHSGLASTRRAVEQKLAESGRDTASLSPRMERLMAATARWATGRGVIVKARQGLTTFGANLDDDEIRYLHAVVRQALV